MYVNGQTSSQRFCWRRPFWGIIIVWSRAFTLQYWGVIIILMFLKQVYCTSSMDNVLRELNPFRDKSWYFGDIVWKIKNIMEAVTNLFGLFLFLIFIKELKKHWKLASVLIFLLFPILSIPDIFINYLSRSQIRYKIWVGVLVDSFKKKIVQF